jgi:acetyl esterase/lipase
MSTKDLDPPNVHVIVLPGGDYTEHIPHEGGPVASWLRGLGIRASTFRYPLRVRHPEPLRALQGEVRRLRSSGIERIGLMGFAAGGHLGGLAALASRDEPRTTIDFAVLGYAITSMEQESSGRARIVLLGEDASSELRRATSLDNLVTRSSPPFFMWHTAEDTCVPPEHTYRLARSLSNHEVPHAVHIFEHGSHGLGLAEGSGNASAWRALLLPWLVEQCLE